MAKSSSAIRLVSASWSASDAPTRAVADFTKVRLPGIACEFVIDERASDAGTTARFIVEPGHGSPAQIAPFAKRITVEAGSIGLTLDYATELLGAGSVRQIAVGQVHGFSVVGAECARLRIETPDATYAALILALAELLPATSWREMERVFRAHGHELVYS